MRTVNAAGTTVILVEQSVNRAMSLAERAFFIERGEVRFDGPTAELLARDDLLRPVFLAEADNGNRLIGRLSIPRFVLVQGVIVGLELRPARPRASS